jgi:hypothetical protein
MFERKRLEIQERKLKQLGDRGVITLKLKKIRGMKIERAPYGVPETIWKEE